MCGTVILWALGPKDLLNCCSWLQETGLVAYEALSSDLPRSTTSGEESRTGGGQWGEVSVGANGRMP